MHSNEEIRHKILKILYERTYELGDSPKGLLEEEMYEPCGLDIPDSISQAIEATGDVIILRRNIQYLIDKGFIEAYLTVQYKAIKISKLGIDFLESKTERQNEKQPSKEETALLPEKLKWYNTTLFRLSAIATIFGTIIGLILAIIRFAS